MRRRYIYTTELNKAVARARGEIDVHLTEYTRVFKLGPPPYTAVKRTLIG